jgi:hypothetical protein
VLWPEFAARAPHLAERTLALYLLDTPGGGLGYLATVRADGGPRVHPVSPVLLDGHLYLFVLTRTPKQGDLRRDGRYALHSWPHPFEADGFDDEELYLTGTATVRADADLRSRVAAETGDAPDTGEVFELSIETAMHKRRRGGLRYEVWRADEAGTRV